MTLEQARAVLASATSTQEEKDKAQIVVNRHESDAALAQLNEARQKIEAELLASRKANAKRDLDEKLVESKLPVESCETIRDVFAATVEKGEAPKAEDIAKQVERERKKLVPLNAGTRVDPDPSNPDLLTAMWFNPGAFKLATAVNGKGNFGNAPLGLLRNPSFSNWDLTLARRIPVRLGRNGGVRLQLQMYNVFNQVNWSAINTTATFNPQGQQTNANFGQATASRAPRIMQGALRFTF